ncbi:nucleoporin NDC1 [Spea bombifrons]|uniref:nucleoporin NDC1 n=1 Tax=Spea bombifrons TaxID=233779 RepID=UPI00234B4595|nr:nucleoporin NDC1 [Spea bombifrons]
MNMLREMQVLKWRLAVSFAWTVLLLPVICMVFITLSKIQLLHPIDWFTASVGEFRSPYTCFCILLLCVVLGIHCIFNVEFFTVVPFIPCSRISLIRQILLPQRVLHSLIHAAMGVMVFWCCSVLSNRHFWLLVAPCTSASSLDENAVPSSCLNEHNLFLLLAGAFLGYSYSLLYFVHNMNYVPFPPIQQFKYLRFRRCLPLLIKHSCIQSLYLVRNYAVVYFFLGYIPRSWILSVMNLQIDGQQPSLDTLRGLLNLSLFYQTWLGATFLLTMWHMVWLLFRIHATEAQLFPVQSLFVQEEEQCLTNVLNSNDPLLKYLAFQDLVLLAQYSPSRRQEVFSLSQPGGHPYNWAAISKECLSLLNNLTARLVAHQEAAAENGRTKLLSTTESQKSFSGSGTSLVEESIGQTPRLSVMSRTAIPSLLKSTYTLKQLASESPLASPVASRVSADINSPWHGSIQSPHVMRRGAKLWTHSPDSHVNGSEVGDISPATNPIPTPVKDQQNLFYTWYQKKQEQMKTYLSKRVLITYLFSKLPEASSQDVFADAQIHIWALEGLSHLVAASFSEDRMGVVQTSLSAILGTFMSLQEAVEKHFKLPHASSKPAKIKETLVDSSYKTLRFALRAALRTAIYRITTTFGEHLHAVPVSSEHRRKLQQFLDFNE